MNFAPRCPMKHWPLYLTVLIQFALFLGTGWHSWKHYGSLIYIRGDGLAYYGWLRSVLIDHDLSFANEFDEHNPLGDSVQKNLTPSGRRANPHPIGPALIWSIAVVPCHVLTLWLGRADGYSWPYQLAVGCATFLCSLVTLLSLYRLGRLYASDRSAALAACLLTLGTSMLYYNAADVSMAHGLGAMMTSVLAYRWASEFGSMRWLRWVEIGAIVGAAGLMRLQLLGFGMLPLCEMVVIICRDRRAWWPVLARFGLACLMVEVAFSPQELAWRLVYGQWLVDTHNLAHHWLSPDLYWVLFSIDRSLFYWTPLTAVALLGFCLARRPAIWILLLAFAFQVYVVASLVGDGVYLGVSYGQRMLNDSLPLLAPGLVLLLDRKRWIVWACAVMMLWNLLLMGQYCLGMLPRNQGAGLEMIWRNTLRSLHTGPSQEASCVCRNSTIGQRIDWLSRFTGAHCSDGSAIPMGPTTAPGTRTYNLRLSSGIIFADTNSGCQLTESFSSAQGVLLAGADE